MKGLTSHKSSQLLNTDARAHLIKIPINKLWKCLNVILVIALFRVIEHSNCIPSNLKSSKSNSNTHSNSDKVYNASWQKLWSLMFWNNTSKVFSFLSDIKYKIKSILFWSVCHWCYQMFLGLWNTNIKCNELFTSHIYFLHFYLEAHNVVI